ncbi:type II secretion system protein GspM [Novosphingobium sp. FKTRR1]|uniref:type II secretion system protein GspM n=1 Tax=Novosphingobium sp. FKTRR1 TaxID=2879118 RepID=UPI001CEFEA48|nr:type II secretion system protein GspM [Novosphingobium sp. FKTRR1]
MIGRLKDWLQALTARERFLVLTALGLGLAVVLVDGLIWPVGRAFDAARARQADSARRSAQVLAAIRTLGPDRPSRNAPRVTPVDQVPIDQAPIDQEVASLAQTAGLVLQTHQPGGGGRTTLIIIRDASATSALSWLDSLADKGLVVETLTMTPQPDGSVAVRATIRRAGE